MCLAVTVVEMIDNLLWMSSYTTSKTTSDCCDTGYASGVIGTECKPKYYILKHMSHMLIVNSTKLSSKLHWPRLILDWVQSSSKLMGFGVLREQSSGLLILTSYSMTNFKL